MMCYKRAWQNQIGLLCNISKTNKNNTDDNSTELHYKMRYINKK